MHLEPDSLEPAVLYQLVIGAIAPRPIAWVTTLGPDGVINLAPFSYFTVAAVRPLTLLFCPQRLPDGSAKDTLRNIETVPEFAVNIPNESTLDAMNVTSWNFPPQVSELAEAGLTPVTGQAIAVPWVAEAPVAFECRLREIVTVGAGPGSGAAVFGEVQCIHLAEGLLDPDSGKVDAAALRPVGRMGGDWYTRVSDRFELARFRPDQGELRGG